MEILELEFELGMVVFGGKFIILEGLLKDIRELVSVLRVRRCFFGTVTGKGLEDFECFVFGVD